MKSSPARVVVALGSNLGDSPCVVREALRKLQPLAAGPLRHSSLWQTSPVDCPPGSPSFVNAVALFDARPGLTPLGLLDQLQTLEKTFGRQPKIVANEARPLDLDIILWGALRMKSKRLILPHPRAQERKFVLQPLAEIAPDLAWPGERETVAQFLGRLPADEPLERLDGSAPA